MKVSKLDESVLDEIDFGWKCILPLQELCVHEQPLWASIPSLCASELLQRLSSEKNCHFCALDCDESISWHIFVFHEAWGDRDILLFWCELRNCHWFFNELLPQPQIWWIYGETRGKINQPRHKLQKQINRKRRKHEKTNFKKNMAETRFARRHSFWIATKFELFSISPISTQSKEARRSQTKPEDEDEPQMHWKRGKERPEPARRSRETEARKRPETQKTIDKRRQRPILRPRKSLVRLICGTHARTGPQTGEHCMVEPCASPASLNFEGWSFRRYFAWHCANEQRKHGVCTGERTAPDGNFIGVVEDLTPKMSRACLGHQDWNSPRPKTTKTLGLGSFLPAKPSCGFSGCRSCHRGAHSAAARAGPLLQDPCGHAWQAPQVASRARFGFAVQGFRVFCGFCWIVQTFKFQVWSVGFEGLGFHPSPTIPVGHFLGLLLLLLLLLLCCCVLCVLCVVCCVSCVVCCVLPKPWTLKTFTQNPKNLNPKPQRPKP